MKVIIAAAGTGGHINPGLAIANKIKEEEKDSEIIFIGTTNEEGKIVIANLEYGKYYILEKNAPKGYKLNEEKMWFEIKEDGQVVKATMKDERIIEVPNTSSNTYLDLIAGGIVLLGASLILVSNLKNKRK